MSWTIKAASNEEIRQHLSQLHVGDVVRTTKSMDIDVKAEATNEAGEAVDLTSVTIEIPEKTWGVIMGTQEMSVDVYFALVPFKVGILRGESDTQNLSGQWSGAHNFSYEEVLTFSRVIPEGWRDQ